MKFQNGDEEKILTIGVEGSIKGGRMKEKETERNGGREREREGHPQDQEYK